jgi:hypothetical protein
MSAFLMAMMAVQCIDLSAICSDDNHPPHWGHSLVSRFKVAPVSFLLVTAQHSATFSQRKYPSMVKDKP